MFSGRERVLGGASDDYLIENKGDIGVLIGVEHVYAQEGEVNLVSIELVDQVFLAALEIIDLNRGIARPVGAEGVCKAVFFRQRK